MSDGEEVTGKKEKAKLQRNPDGEAVAQFRDQDFDFGGKKKQMMGSEGQIIMLDDDDAEAAATPPKQFKASISGTQQKTGKWFMAMLDNEYTVFEFKIAIGDKKWNIGKRFSDFDKLDNRLNDKFGLPPVGLPPKQWFGLEDAELIQMRHKVLLAYIQDCLKRPVLIHSRDLQDFVEMPEEVVKMVSG
eukprot:CAMPEP_0180158092 /NCGR_PEP_ID=MMETSP0986-20121125/26681_1 /TAXON_ID=697907 /ORGANISM="non described non described, Strain CCMP2293" /LENGTH=187 /DNA_ID=CAMNT_0022107837 /DNA_START=48 /DNA_END=607 /DNA_ORIENTATION=-